MLFNRERAPVVGYGERLLVLEEGFDHSLDLLLTGDNHALPTRKPCLEAHIRKVQKIFRKVDVRIARYPINRAYGAADDLDRVVRCKTFLVPHLATDPVPVEPARLKAVLPVPSPPLDVLPDGDPNRALLV